MGKRKGYPEFRFPVSPPRICAACWYSNADLFEHLLPRSIGGLISVNLPCKKCNSDFGSGLETEWKSNLHLRIAFEHIKSCAPLAYKNFTKRARFVGRSRSGPPVGMVPAPSGAFRILTQSQPDGSRTLDSRSAPKELQHEFLKLGVSELEATDFALNYSSLPNDLWLPTPDSRTFIIKRDVEKIEPQLQGTTASDAALLKIALMHVSVIMHPGSFPGLFLPLIRAIQDGNTPSGVGIRSQMPKRYRPRPNHIVRFVPSQNSLVIGIQFLGILRYEVQINGLQAEHIRDIVIVHDLKGLRVLFSPSFSAFQKGKLYRLS